jgi:hypothetical protein
MPARYVGLGHGVESDDWSDDDRNMLARHNKEERGVEMDDGSDDDRKLSTFVDDDEDNDIESDGSHQSKDDDDRQMPAHCLGQERGVEMDDWSDNDHKLPASVDNVEEDNQKDVCPEHEEADERPQAKYASMDPIIHVGIIVRVYVENFMCHRKFTIDFCRKVNFITGPNGSRKSAILAAIQICLGSGARSTHRADDLKDLIRMDGTRNQPKGAIVRVSLTNEGSEPHEADTYGKRSPSSVRSPKVEASTVTSF